MNGALTFGGSWTELKLEVLRKYMDAYTTILKKQRFKLMYIDAFAGTGYINLGSSNSDEAAIVQGSARIALEVSNKHFDELYFVEKDRNNCLNLYALQNEYGKMESRTTNDVHIENTDANSFLQNLALNRSQYRGLLFIDPYGTELEWETIMHIASLRVLDIWILFPVSTISRMLPKNKMPDDSRRTKLNRIYGNDAWEEIYKETLDLFGTPNTSRDSGVNKLIEVYKSNLKNLFRNRFLAKTAALNNSNNVRLFELIFCVGSDSDRAISAAKGVANHLLDNI